MSSRVFEGITAAIHACMYKYIYIYNQHPSRALMILVRVFRPLRAVCVPLFAPGLFEAIFDVCFNVNNAKMRFGCSQFEPRYTLGLSLI
jgi:hypothetical protein